MSLKLFISSVLFFFFLLFYTSAGTFYCDSCQECTDYISNGSMNSGDILEISRNINSDINELNSCIEFNEVVGITLDCKNNLIIGSGFFYDSHLGIKLSQSSHNTIKNCNLSNFFYGIDASFSSSNIFENVTITNSWWGFSLTNSKNNSIFSSNISNNYDKDLAIYDCTNTIEDTYLSNGRIGYIRSESIIENISFSTLYLCGAHNSVLRNITILEGDGLNVFESYNLSFKDFKISDSADIQFSNSGNISLLNFVSLRNSRNGLNLFNVSNFNGDNLNLSFNSDAGLFASLSNQILLKNSYIKNNTAGIVLINTTIDVFNTSLDNYQNYSLFEYSELNFIECVNDSDCSEMIFCGSQEVCMNGYCMQPLVSIDDGIECTTSVCYENNESIVTTYDDSLCDDGDSQTIGTCSVELEMCIFERILDSSSPIEETPRSPIQERQRSLGYGNDAFSSIYSQSLYDFSHSLRNIDPGVSYSIDINKDLTVLSLSLRFRNHVNSAQLNIRTLESLPVGIQEKKDAIKYLEVSLDSESDSVDSIIFKFKLERKYDDGLIMLNRFVETDRIWVSYPTKVIEYDSYFSFYEASVPGFSFFSISYETIPVVDKSINQLTANVVDSFENIIPEKYTDSKNITQNYLHLVTSFIILSVAVTCISILILLKIASSIKRKL